MITRYLAVIAVALQISAGGAVANPLSALNKKFIELKKLADGDAISQEQLLSARKEALDVFVSAPLGKKEKRSTRLYQLEQLKTQGTISEEEYSEAQAKAFGLFGAAPNPPSAKPHTGHKAGPKPTPEKPAAEYIALYKVDIPSTPGWYYFWASNGSSRKITFKVQYPPNGQVVVYTLEGEGATLAPP